MQGVCVSRNCWEETEPISILEAKNVLTGGGTDSSFLSESISTMLFRLGRSSSLSGSLSAPLFPVPPVPLFHVPRRLCSTRPGVPPKTSNLPKWARHSLLDFSHDPVIRPTFVAKQTRNERRVKKKSHPGDVWNFGEQGRNIVEQRWDNFVTASSTHCLTDGMNDLVTSCAQGGRREP